MTVAISETYNTAFEVDLTARLGVTFTARPAHRTGKEPVREIAGVPPAMIEFFSRRRAAIEARYAELVRDYRDRARARPGRRARRDDLARQANLDTRAGQEAAPLPRETSGPHGARNSQARFGSDAIGPADERQSPPAPCPAPPRGLPQRRTAPHLAERAWLLWPRAAPSGRRGTSGPKSSASCAHEVPALAPGRHRETADAVTASPSPRRSVCVEPPPLLDEPAGAAPLRTGSRCSPSTPPPDTPAKPFLTPKRGWSTRPGRRPRRACRARRWPRRSTGSRPSRHGPGRRAARTW